MQEEIGTGGGFRFYMQHFTRIKKEFGLDNKKTSKSKWID